MGPSPELHSGAVFVVDDDPLVCRSLGASLSLAGFDVTKFSSAEDLLAQVTPGAPGCVLTDFHMPGMDGLALQQELARRNTVLAVIIMTGHGDIPLAVRAMKAGAMDFLQKPFRHKQLVAHVAAALSQSREKARETQKANRATQRLSILSSREREVLHHVVSGRTNKEIARLLEISPRTVEIHRAHIMEKTDAGSLAELVRLAEAES
jgi:two-component system response regulator FixJ